MHKRGLLLCEALGSTGFLWKLLAGLQATLSVWLIQATQHNPSLTLLAVIVWGGAVICIEDQLDQLEPRPTRAGWTAGLTLLLFCTLRSLSVLDKDTAVLVLPLLQGAALVLLLQPIRQLASQAQPLIVLSLFPLQELATRFLPDFWLSAVTAKITQVYLLLFGLNAATSGRYVLLGQRGVAIQGACNSVDLIAQLTTIAIVFVLAFPIRSRILQLSFVAIAPVLAILVNAGRIAILAALNSSSLANRDDLFTFMHDEWGALVFAGIATMVLGQMYLALVERELRLRRG
jgi:exosortase/archaeosortase family protein